jgi:hypothetical protein
MSVFEDPAIDDDQLATDMHATRGRTIGYCTSVHGVGLFLWMDQDGGNYVQSVLRFIYSNPKLLKRVGMFFL